MFVLPQPFPHSSLDPNPHPDLFMKNQAQGFPPPLLNPHGGALYKPVQPRRRRKRKLAETDIEDVNPFHSNSNGRHSILSTLRNPTKEIDAGSVSLQFMKQSNKRKRTNQMEHSKDQIHVDASLERNIYTHDPSRPPQQSHAPHSLSTALTSKRGKEEADDGDGDQDRIKAPYEHPYHLAASLSPQNRSKSPEDMMHDLRLNAFRMENRDNEGVTEWRHSIESQLMSARDQTPAQIEELCKRITSTSGLGRDVLMAKLRKQLPQEVFGRVCRTLDGQRSQSV